MKFEQKQAESLGLVVGGKNGTALVHPVHGFAGRRIYVDRGSKTQNVEGPCIHLSGFHEDEVEMLGGTLNTKAEFSARVTGFLKLTAENLKAAAQMILDANTPAREPAKGTYGGVDVAAIIEAAASK